MRRKIVVGNWKMNNTIAESETLAAEVIAELGENFSGCEVGIAPTFIALEATGRVIEGSEVQLVAQNCHYENDGAFTGEVSARICLLQVVPLLLLVTPSVASILVRPMVRSIVEQKSIVGRAECYSLCW